jgi:tRNA-dihydrouridine synthase B
MPLPRLPIDLVSPVLLAPMSGITDAPLRAVVAGFGAGAVVSEMIAAGEMITARPSRRAASRARGQGVAGVPTIVQLAGRDPRWMAEAARMAEDDGAPMIDLNNGCPAKKVTGGLSGAALMREPDLAARLVEAVAQAVSVPVSVKMRLGWDDLCAPDHARRMVDAGARMITVHGRTRMQFYTGQADWAAVGAVVRAVSVPVVVNGDITDAASARAALALSGAAAVMVGRAVQGRPWVLAQIGAALSDTAAPQAPRGDSLLALVRAHYEAMLSFYGRELGLRIARKHLGWYLEAAGGCPVLRARLMRESDPGQVLAILPEALSMGEAA